MPAPAVLQSYSVMNSPEGFTMVFAGSPIAEQVMFDLVAAESIANPPVRLAHIAGSTSSSKGSSQLGNVISAELGAVQLGTSVNTTLSPINTTGASLILAAVATQTGSSTTGFSDSAGNTWSLLNPYYIGSGAPGILIFFTKATPRTSTTHTFSYNSGGNNYPAMSVVAYSGTGIVDVQNGATVLSAITLQPGDITPNLAGELLFTAIASNPSANTFSIDSDFTIIDYVKAVGGLNWGIATADLLGGGPVPPKAVNPIWSSSASVEAAATIVGIQNVPPAFSQFSVCDNALKEALDGYIEENQQPLYPSPNVYPSDNLYPAGYGNLIRTA